MHFKKTTEKPIPNQPKVFETRKTKKINFNGFEKSSENLAPNSSTIIQKKETVCKISVSNFAEIKNEQKRVSSTTPKNIGKSQISLNSKPKSRETKIIISGSKIEIPKPGKETNLNLYSCFGNIDFRKNKSGINRSDRPKNAQIQLYKEVFRPQIGKTQNSKNQELEKHNKRKSIEVRLRIQNAATSSYHKHPELSRNPSKVSLKNQINSNLKLSSRDFLHFSSKQIPLFKNPHCISDNRSGIYFKNPSMALFSPKRIPTVKELQIANSSPHFQLIHPISAKFATRFVSIFPNTNPKQAKLNSKRDLNPSSEIESRTNPTLANFKSTRKTSTEFQQTFLLKKPFRKLSDKINENQNLGFAKSIFNKIGNKLDGLNVCRSHRNSLEIRKLSFSKSEIVRNLSFVKPSANLDNEIKNKEIIKPIEKARNSNMSKIKDKLNGLIRDCSNSNLNPKRDSRCSFLRIKSSLNLHSQEMPISSNQENKSRDSSNEWCVKINPANKQRSKHKETVGPPKSRIDFEEEKKTTNIEKNWTNNFEMAKLANKKNESENNLLIAEIQMEDESSQNESNQNHKTPEKKSQNSHLKKIQNEQKCSIFSFQKLVENVKIEPSSIFSKAELKAQTNPNNSKKIRDANLSSAFQIPKLRISTQKDETSFSENFSQKSTDKINPQTAHQRVASPSNKSDSIQKISQKIISVFENWDLENQPLNLSFSTFPDCYQLQKQIGKGCFGTVHLARQRLTNLPVALKVISKNSMIKDNNHKISQEILFLKSISNQKYLVKLFEVFEDETNIYLVMEYYPHGDLITFFKNRELLNEDQLRPLFLKIVKAVEQLHKLSIIHRDIKMDNILLDKNLDPVLCDFGISSMYHPNKPILDTGGTPAYLAPEVIRANGDVSFKTDVWGLGILLFALTFGNVPFEGDDIQDLYKTILQGKFRFPAKRRFSRELADLISGMILVDVKKRFSIREILQHPWINNVGLGPTIVSTEIEIANRKDERTKKETVIRYLNDFGFGLDFIYESLNGMKFNHVTACFENLMRNWTN